MFCPSSQVSKALLGSFVTVLGYFAFMDVNLYLRIRNYPIDTKFENNSNCHKYEDQTWISCDVNPLCTVTVKAVLLDHTNYYLFAPLVTIVDDIFAISARYYVTPNAISVFHVFVAILSAKCISSDSLAYRRIGAALFELRTFLDDLDGHVARVRKHVKGEHSEVGTAGYFVDGICDAIGCTFLMIGVFVFFKSNPPRRGYMSLPTTLTETKEMNLVYKTKISSGNIVKKVLCFSAQLLISSMAWNRYIAMYQDLLEGSDANNLGRNLVFKSAHFFAVAFLWRVVNVHNMLHCLMLAIFCDKLWEFLRNVQYVGFCVLVFVICVTEIHVSEVRKIVFNET